MSYKIPDAPDIVGGTPVLRQPQEVRPTSVVVDARVDFKDQINAVKTLGNIYAERVQEQENVLDTAVQNSYKEYMANEWLYYKKTHQGKDASDPYPFLKAASDKFVADVCGEPKDDGKVRFKSNVMKNRFKNWVDGQQGAWISAAANYGEQEWNRYANTVWDSAINDNTMVIVNAESPQSLQNGIDGITATIRNKNKGYDESYIRGEIAKTVDNAMSGYIDKKITSVGPVAAFYAITTDPIVASSLTPATKEKLLKNIRDSYKDTATREYANGEITGYHRDGMIDNKVLISEVFGVTSDADIKAIQGEIIDNGNKRVSAIREQTAGMTARATNNAASQVFAGMASGDFDALQTGLQNVPDKSLAAALEKSIENGVVVQQGANIISTIGLDVSSGTRELQESRLSSDAEEYYSQFKEEFDLAETTQEKLDVARKYGGISADFAVGLAMAELGGSIPAAPMPGYERKEALAVAGEQIKKRFSSDVKNKVAAMNTAISDHVDSLVARGDLDERNAPAVKAYMQAGEQRIATMEDFVKDYADIAKGVVGSINTDMVNKYTTEQVKELNRQAGLFQQWADLKRGIKDASGQDIDKIMKDTGVMPEYDGYDLESQNNLRQNFLLKVNTYRKNNNGEYPDGAHMNQLAIEAANVSKSSGRIAVEDIQYFMSSGEKELTEISSAIPSAYNYSTLDRKNRTYDKYGKRTEAAVNKLARSSALTIKQQDFVKQHPDKVKELLQGGELGILQLSNLLNFYKE